MATEYAEKLEENLRKVHSYVRKTLGQEAKRQKEIYDSAVKSKIYKVGELVWRNQKKNVAGKKSKISRH